MNRLLGLILFLLSVCQAPAADGIFDYCTTLDAMVDTCHASATQGCRAYIRLPRDHKVVRAVLYAHQNMTEEVLFRSAAFLHKMDSLGVAMAFVQLGSQNWDVTLKDSAGRTCQDRFIRLMNDFAQGTGHPEIATAKVIPFGHSAQATFPWNFAAWNKERTLCILSFHGDAPLTNLCGYGGANISWGRTRNIDRIPALMVVGEYEWWEARVNPALAFRMMYPDSRISFLCDAGRGHFDLSVPTQMYIAKFIEKALCYKPVSTVSADDDPRFVSVAADGVMYSRWYADGRESTDVHDQFWYFDDEMVALTRKRYQESWGKKRQYVSCLLNGNPMRYDAKSHIKIKGQFSGDTFTVTPVFVNSSYDGASEHHAKVRPRVMLISGAAVQTGEYTFKVDSDYFGKDPKRLWDGITLCVEADGDDVYKSSVQEINVRPSTF